MNENLSISLAVEYDRRGLAARWQELAEKTESSFFQSWHWIGTWLSVLPENVAPLLLKVRRGEVLIALALFCEQQCRGVFGNALDVLFLNETGDPHLDVLAPEYNDLLGDPTLREVLWPHVASFLIDQHGADEIVLSGLEGFPQTFEHPRRILTAINRVDKSLLVSLDAVRKAPSQDLLAILGSSTRSQLRKSMLEVGGPEKLQVSAAESVEEALGYFDALKQLHQTRWSERGEPGAFGAPFFEFFHHELITREFKNGVIDLLKINGGETVLGYLYNFRYKGSVLNYQGGFNFENPKSRPGMLCHLAAVNFYAKTDFKYYDLLAGDTQYKRSLSQEQREMYWGKVVRKTKLVVAENFLRSVKRKIFKVKRNAP